MPSSTELSKPSNENDFERLCLALYSRVWRDPYLMRVGRRGQKQRGVDLIGTREGRPAGIQCKCYHATTLSLAVIKDDIKKADDAGLNIDHLLFATTANNDANLVFQVKELSDRRKEESRFTVSVDFWDAVSTHIHVYPEVGRAHIDNFPGGDAERAREILEEQVPLIEKDRERSQSFQVESLKAIYEIGADVKSLLDKIVSPQSRGDELNKLVAKHLDKTRELISQDRIVEARGILETIKEEALSADDFTQFRWHTNMGACLLRDDRETEAASEYLVAFDRAPSEEKALANRVRALLLLGRLEEGFQAAEEGLVTHPESPLIWALRLNARQLRGDSTPEDDLPESVARTPGVLHVLVQTKLDKGNLKEAYQLSRELLQVDEDSIDAKRTVLIAAVALSTSSLVCAHFRHLSAEKKSALKVALDTLEPIEETIEKLESANLVQEVTTNAALALNLLGNPDRAESLVERGLRRFPEAEGLLTLRLNWLEKKGETNAIRALTDQRLDTLSSELLLCLAEISANAGDLAWHNQVQTHLAMHALSERQTNDLAALSVYAQFSGGQRDQAVEKAIELDAAGSNNALLQIVLVGMLDSVGQRERAEQYLASLYKCAGEGDDAPLLIQTADLCWNFGEFSKAADLYGRLADSPGNDYITHRYLGSLIESDQRERARRVIESLDTDARKSSAIRRIEATLARQSGDWNRLYQLLSSEIEQAPGDSAIATGFVGATHRLQKEGEIKAYLESNPSFDKTSAENEFEFAKYQALYGFDLLAVDRMYRAFRQQPNDPKIAGLYLTTLLLAENSIDWKGAAAVPGTAILLSRATDRRWVALEVDGLSEIATWPEVVQSSSELGLSLVGKVIGDDVQFNSGVGLLEYKVEQIQSIYLFTSRKAQELIAASAAPLGPLFSLPIIKEGGEPDITAIRESLANRSRFVRNTIDVYSNKKMPVCTLAEALGTDPISLLLEWPSQHTEMFVSRGTKEEREGERKALSEGNSSIVLDLISIAELVRWEVFDAACNSMGTPVVPHTVVEQLLGLLQTVRNPKPQGSLREEDGQLIWDDIPKEYFTSREEFLTRVLKAVQSKCELLPAFGPEVNPDLIGPLSKILDSSSLDAVLLSLQLGARLVTIDATLRLLASAAGVEEVAGIQPLLMNLRDEGHLHIDEYSRIVLSKLASGHEFTSVDSDDLFWAARHAQSSEEDLLRPALESFGKSNVELQSVILACLGLLRLAATEFPAREVAGLYEQVLGALTKGRNSLAQNITDMLRQGVNRILIDLLPSKEIELRYAFGDLIDRQGLPGHELDLVAYAVRKTLYAR